MTLSAPTSRRRLRGFPSADTARIPEQVVLMVDFTSLEGRKWSAVGVGDNLADAIAFARDSCPSDATWRPLDWNDLYGD
jgi:hypothetical protein